MTAPSNSKQPSIDPLVIAISSRALFDLAESHQVYEEEGLAAYQQYQIARESEPLPPGDAFSLVQKLLRLNEQLEESPVQVILLSRNSADTGLRIFNSIKHYASTLVEQPLAAAKALTGIYQPLIVIYFSPQMELM